jgi:hypothetical protein
MLSRLRQVIIVVFTWTSISPVFIVGHCPLLGDPNVTVGKPFHVENNTFLKLVTIGNRSAKRAVTLCNYLV